MSSDIESPSCQYGTVPGTPNGIRAVITMGELKGMILAQTAKEPEGLDNAEVMSTIEIMMSIVTGKLSDCASRTSSLMALPIAP